MSNEMHTKNLCCRLLLNPRIQCIKMAVIGFWGVRPQARPHVSELKELMSKSNGSLEKITFVSDILDCNKENLQANIDALFALDCHLSNLHLVISHTRCGIYFNKNKKSFASIFHETYFNAGSTCKLKCLTVGVDETTDPFGLKREGMSCDDVLLLNEVSDIVIIKDYSEVITKWF